MNTLKKTLAIGATILASNILYANGVSEEKGLDDSFFSLEEKVDADYEKTDADSEELDFYTETPDVDFPVYTVEADSKKTDVDSETSDDNVENPDSDLEDAKKFAESFGIPTDDTVVIVDGEGLPEGSYPVVEDDATANIPQEDKDELVKIINTYSEKELNQELEKAQKVLATPVSDLIYVFSQTYSRGCVVDKDGVVQQFENTPINEIIKNLEILLGKNLYVILGGSEGCEISQNAKGSRFHSEGLEDMAADFMMNKEGLKSTTIDHVKNNCNHEFSKDDLRVVKDSRGNYEAVVLTEESLKKYTGEAGVCVNIRNPNFHKGKILVQPNHLVPINLLDVVFAEYVRQGYHAAAVKLEFIERYLEQAKDKNMTVAQYREAQKGLLDSFEKISKLEDKLGQTVEQLDAKNNWGFLLSAHGGYKLNNGWGGGASVGTSYKGFGVKTGITVGKFDNSKQILDSRGSPVEGSDSLVGFTDQDMKQNGVFVIPELGIYFVVGSDKFGILPGAGATLNITEYSEDNKYKGSIENNGVPLPGYENVSFEGSKSKTHFGPGFYLELLLYINNFMIGPKVSCGKGPNGTDCGFYVQIGTKR